MKLRSLMNRNAIIALSIVAALIGARSGNVLAQEGEVKTAKESVQTISFGSNILKLNSDSTHDKEEILKGDILSAEKHNDQGIAYSEKGQYDLAISEFNKSIDLYPLSAETYNNRGIAYSRKGDLDRAIADFTKAVDINPEGAKAFYNRGITYALKGQINLALADLKKCLELDPSNAAAHETMGSVLVWLACSNWATACRLGSCEYMNEAVRIGLCIAATGNSPLSPRSGAQ